MIATVVSQVNNCKYWIEAHGDDFRDEVGDQDLAEQLKKDWRAAQLSDIDKILCSWVEKLTLTPGNMNKKHVEKLESVGFSQSAISDAAQVAGYFNYINRIADGLGVDLEDEIK